MNNLMKHILNSIYKIVVFPLYLLVCFNHRISGTENTFSAFAQMLSRISGKHGEFARRAYYNYTLRYSGKDLLVSFGSLFTHRDASVGDRIYIGQYSIIGSVSIDSNVMISDHVSILSGKYQHMYNEEGILVESEKKDPFISIGKSSWIGANSVIMNNIGEGSIIGAGSVVVKPIESFSVAAGSPAKVIRKRGKEDDNGL